MRTGTSFAVVPMVVLLTGCLGGASSDAGTDGGFPDTPVVLVEPTHVVEEGEDLGLLLALRLDPWPMTLDDYLETLEVEAYDATTGELAWTDREEIPWGHLGLDVAVGTADPRTGVIEMRMRRRETDARFDYDPRSEAWVTPIDEDLWGVGYDPLDFGAFDVRRACGSTAFSERIFGRDSVESFCYQPGPIRPPIGPRTVVGTLTRGPGGTLVLDAIRYGPPEQRLREISHPEPDGSLRSEYVREFFERRIDGVRDVFVVEVETGGVVALGERHAPPGVDHLRLGPGEGSVVVDRPGRMYFRSDRAVTREPIYLVSLEDTQEELALDWGDATECLLTQIYAVGPEGHILTVQRAWVDAYPAGVVCLFAPDGSLVLSLPADPLRAWVGFSDPVQWY